MFKYKSSIASSGVDGSRITLVEFDRVKLIDILWFGVAVWQTQKVKLTDQTTASPGTSVCLSVCLSLWNISCEVPQGFFFV